MVYRISISDRTVLAWHKVTGELSNYRKAPLSDGVHRLARSGAIDVLRGRIVGVVPPACSSAWSVSRGPGGFQLMAGALHPTGGRSPSRRTTRPSTAILDLAGGDLVLVEGDRVSRLEEVSLNYVRATPTYTVLDRSRRSGSTSPAGGDPALDLDFDFSP